MSYSKIQNLLEANKVVLLDGGFGTELRRRHVQGVDDPHIWSARGLLNSPRTVLDIHRDYILAGADVITAGAFRTNSRALRKAGLDGLAKSLTHFAVHLAMEMRQQFANTWEFAIAGNVTSLENCYAPEMSPGRAALPEHREKVDHLRAAGADLILFESIPSSEEALAALEASAHVDLPIWLSLVLDERKNPPQLKDGLRINEIKRVLRTAARQPDVLMFNCSRPESVTRAIPILRAAYDGHIGAYANVEVEVEQGKPWERRCEMTTFAYRDAALNWIKDGARVVGGCCGTTPDDIRAIRDAIGWKTQQLVRGDHQSFAHTRPPEGGRRVVSPRRARHRAVR